MPSFWSTNFWSSEITCGLIFCLEAICAWFALANIMRPEEFSLSPKSWLVRTPKESRDPRKLKEFAQFVANAVLAVGFGVSSLPVFVKWIAWFLCFCALIYTVQSAVNSLSELPIQTRLLGSLMLASVFVGVCWDPATSTWAEEKSKVLSGDLLGGSSQAFNDTVARFVPMIDMGTSASPSGIIMLPKEGKDVEPYFNFFPDSVVKLELGKRGPMVTTTIRDRLGNKIVEVDRNHWQVFPSFCSDKNYTDRALEVLDNSGHVLLQLVILPDRVRVHGEWWDNEGHGRRIVPSPQGGALIIPLGLGVQHNEALVKRIFKYPSSEHWGELDN
jgi:hypothetical protein